MEWLILRHERIFSFRNAEMFLQCFSRTAAFDELSRKNELAEKVDLSREYIADIERGLKNISLRKLYMLADVLNTKCSDLVNFD